MRDMSQRRLVGGRYELRDLIAQSVSVDTWRARDTLLHSRAVVVKIFRDTGDEAFRFRFRRNAGAAVRMDHPEIARLYEAGEDTATGAPLPYIVMEYVDGRALWVLLREVGHLPPQRVLDIASGVLRALDYAHQIGLVHRDINPDHVMVTRHGDVKVLNFGKLSKDVKVLDVSKLSGLVASEIAYQPPEYLGAGPVDARSDVYSTGCLMYEMLVGRQPFLAEGTMETFKLVLQGGPALPSRLVPRLPAWADAIISKATAKAPEDRYQTAAEMLADIHLQKSLGKSLPRAGQGSRGVREAAARPARRPKKVPSPRDVPLT